MFFPLYLAAMGISAGIVGVFGRKLLAQAGYIPNFDVGLAAAAMIACGYIILQCGYGGVIQLVKPYKGKGPHLTETLSLLSAVLLVPYLLNVQIPWPHPKLAELEPVLFLAAFGILHGAFKLGTLFAATQATPATQIRVLPYVGFAFLAYLGGHYTFNLWYQSLSVVRSASLEELAPLRAGDTIAWARPVTEGLLYPLEARIAADEHLTLRWASQAEESEEPDTIHVTCTFYGEDGETALGTWKDTVTLEFSNWTTQRIPNDVIPPAATRLGLVWNQEEESAWVQQTGLRPAQTSGASMFLSGPYAHSAPKTFQRPNLVILLVEGMGADHMELFGYDRQTTPELTSLAKRSSVWETAFTGCPDTLSTAMTLMTGVAALEHGYTDARRGPLPASLATLPERMRESGYVTVAFTEGEASDDADLVFGSGIERGFELFNSAYSEVAPTNVDGPAPLVPAGARETLQRAADWIGKHRSEERYLVFIRLRELRKPFALKRYGQGFIKPWEDIPQPLDVYDTALLDVDKQIGLFAERLREMGSFEDTCIVFTSPYGLDFSEPERGVWRRGGPGVPRLTEESIRVPLIISMPEGISRTRRGIVSLNDLGRTLADFAGVSLSRSADVRSLLDSTSGTEAVTVMGNPVSLSLRTESWRYNWQTGRDAVTLAPVSPASTLALYNIDDYHNTWQNKDFAGRESQIASSHREQLTRYLDPFVNDATESPSP